MKIEGNTLIVGLNDGPARISEEIEVEITGPVADALKLAGSVDFTCGRLGVEGSDLKVEVAGSTDVRISSISAAELIISAAGSCDINLGEVNASSFESVIAGSGNIDAAHVNADSADLTIAGSGDMDMYLNVNELNASIAGSGELALKGSVSRRAKYSIAGSGHIDAKDLKCPATSYETKGGSITYHDADGHLVKED